MTVNSDPNIERVRDHAQHQRTNSADRAFVQIITAEHELVAVRAFRWRLAGVAVLCVGLAVAVSLMVWSISSPLAVSPAGAAPAWSVEITAAGAEPITALVYGEEAGLHLVRVPAANAPGADARTISARLAKGELHMISLGRASLRARANAPSGAAPMAWSAEGHIITAFQNPQGTGVRTSW